MDILEEKGTYYEEKIKLTFNEFKKLFLQMLKDKGCTYVSDISYFTTIAKKVQQFYPQIAERVDTILCYYSDEEDTEEKLENMMRLYKTVKEEIYGN